MKLAPLCLHMDHPTVAKDCPPDVKRYFLEQKNALDLFIRQFAAIACRCCGNDGSGGPTPPPPPVTTGFCTYTWEAVYNGTAWTKNLLTSTCMTTCTSVAWTVDPHHPCRYTCTTCGIACSLDGDCSAPVTPSDPSVTPSNCAPSDCNSCSPPLPDTLAYSATTVIDGNETDAVVYIGDCDWNRTGSKAFSALDLTWGGTNWGVGATGAKFGTGYGWTGGTNPCDPTGTYTPSIYNPPGTSFVIY